MIEEGKAPGFAAERTVPDPCEPDVVLVGLFMEFGYDTLAYHLVVPVYLFQEEITEFHGVCVMFCLESLGQVEQPRA